MNKDRTELMTNAMDKHKSKDEKSLSKKHISIHTFILLSEQKWCNIKKENNSSYNRLYYLFRYFDFIFLCEESPLGDGVIFRSPIKT